MVKIILIITYVIVFGVFAAVFLFYGKKRGWRGGVAAVISSAAAFILSYFISPLLASELLEIQPVRQLLGSLLDAASENDLDSAPFVNILSDSVQRILEIPSAIVLYILFFVAAFVLTRTVMRFIKPGNGEQTGKSKLIGAALGAASPVIVAVLTLFVPKINLFNEAESIESILLLASKPANEMVTQICSDTDRYTKILFETTLTDADENQRLEFVNRSIRNVVFNTGDGLLIECFEDFEGYSSRSAFEADIRAAAELYQSFDGIDLFAEGDFAPRLFAVQDKTQLSQKLYQLSFKDCLIRYVISYVVHDLTNSNGFIYPKGEQILGTYEDFASLVMTADKFENGQISQLDLLVEIKDSPLLPTELYAELIFTNFGN